MFGSCGRYKLLLILLCLINLFLHLINWWSKNMKQFKLWYSRFNTLLSFLIIILIGITFYFIHKNNSEYKYCLLYKSLIILLCLWNIIYYFIGEKYSLEYTDIFISIFIPIFISTFIALCANN